MRDQAEIFNIARLLHGRLRSVAQTVGEAIGAQGGAFADHRDFYWHQTALLHNLAITDPLARALWAEAFAEGYAQGVARREGLVRETGVVLSKTP